MTQTLNEVQPQADALAALNPHRIVDLSDGRTVTVGPVSFRNMARFNRAVGRIVNVLLSVGWDGSPFAPADAAAPLPADDDAALFAAVKAWVQRHHAQLAALLPMLTDEVLDLVDECCAPRLSEVNPLAGDVTFVVMTWVEVNASEAQLRPLVRTVERVVLATTGKPADLWTPLRSSLASLPPATPPTT